MTLSSGLCRHRHTCGTHTYIHVSKHSNTLKTNGGSDWRESKGKKKILFPRLGKTQCYGLELAYLTEQCFKPDPILTS